MLRLSKNKDMEIIKRNKYKDTYIKSHYINKYLIDDIDVIRNYVVISLNENDTLLNFKF